MAVAFVVSILLAYFVLNAKTTSTFDRLERQNVAAQADRVRATLSNDAGLSREFVLTNAQWTEAVMAGRKACGVLAAAEGHYLFCSAPVVHDDGSGPAAGTLVALKALDAAAVGSSAPWPASR